MGRFNELFLENTQSVDEKLKVFAPGIKASGVAADGNHHDKVHQSTSRMKDEHKDTEFGKSHRKDAADKIRAARKSTGAVGSRELERKAPGFAVYKEGTDQIDEVAILIEYIEDLESAQAV